jgi:hypothetical protein
MASPSRSEGAVLRVSRGRFDPARHAGVERLTVETGACLAPAIAVAPGLPSPVAATSPDGVTPQVSVWTSDAAVKPTPTLPETRAGGEAEAPGVAFEPIVQFRVNWTVGAQG